MILNIVLYTFLENKASVTDQVLEDVTSIVYIDDETFGNENTT